MDLLGLQRGQEVWIMIRSAVPSSHAALLRVVPDACRLLSLKVRLMLMSGHCLIHAVN